MTVVRKKVGSSGAVRFVKFSESKPGDVLVTGTFQGTQLVDSFDGSKKVPLHTFLTEDGETVKLNSAGQLDKNLENVTPGSVLEITFLGKESFKSKDGRKLTANQFEVHELVEDEAAPF